MSEKLNNNPFALLFSSVKEAEHFIQQQNEQVTGAPQLDDRSSGVEVSEEEKFLEGLLLVTTHSGGPFPNPRVLLPDSEGSSLTHDSFPHLLFERLLLQDPEAHLVGPGDEEARQEAGQGQIVPYLSEVYRRCWAARDRPLAHLAKEVQEHVVTNLTTALQQPELYGGQRPDVQLQEVLLKDLGREAAVDHLASCLVAQLAREQAAESPPPLFHQLLGHVTVRLEKCTLMTLDYHLLDILDFYAAYPYLACLLTHAPPDSSLPHRDPSHRKRGYQRTPLGSLLSVSCLPKQAGQPYEFFTKPSSQPAQVLKDTESSIFVAQSNINARTYKIFYALLKVSPEAKDGLLTWIEGCLEANSGRAGLWHLQDVMGMQGQMYVCDGFMINLGAVLLQLAQPFTNSPRSDKILKVDPTYCAAPGKRKAKSGAWVAGAYTGDLGEQTCLVPVPSHCQQQHSSSFSFITTCFFLTHRALHLGMQVVQQKLSKMSQELGRLEREVQEMTAQGSPASQMLKNHLESRTILLLSLKAAVFEPQTAESLLQFLGATAEWLVQMALCSPTQQTPPTSLQEVAISQLREEEEDTQQSHHFLQCIPEFLVETLTETIRAVRRYSPELLEGLAMNNLLPRLMSFIVVFMGSSRRMNNPHLRASLAECLEILLPGSGGSGLLVGLREQLFSSHPLAAHIAPALIQVFVSIEMTGQSVAFEEKFNYRRPMYEVMKYVWELPNHRRRFTELANEALANMESAKQPLFLRFVNLLMNDATFLLDEGLSYMSQLRELQKERESESWQGLDQEERRAKERHMQQLTSLARFHNVLGTHTIHTLIMLTKEIPEMFTHSTLVDRMAAMLNYFLATLVGPKQGSLKVRDREKYNFRPGEIVSDICILYTHLYRSPGFCAAVCGDGRSYTPLLFSQAQDVLYRISRGLLAAEIEEVAKAVTAAAQAIEEDEDIVADAPEEFLDPIMSHLMTDPVMLPTSKLTCDRQTIARHLLSDQTDPFNRQPLTMQEVIANTELKQRITVWLEEQRKFRKSKPKESKSKEMDQN